MLYPTTFEFNFPRLVPPNAKLVGPMLPEAPKPIVDRELASFIDHAKEGFVLVRRAAQHRDLNLPLLSSS